MEINNFKIKGDSRPNDKYDLSEKKLNEPWILIQVSSKLVEEWWSYGHLKNSNMANI